MIKNSSIHPKTLLNLLCLEFTVLLQFYIKYSKHYTTINLWTVLRKLYFGTFKAASANILRSSEYLLQQKTNLIIEYSLFSINFKSHLK